MRDNPSCLFFSSHPRSFLPFSSNFLPLTVRSPWDRDKTALKRESAQQLVCLHVRVCETAPMGESVRLRIISFSLMPGQLFFFFFPGINLENNRCVCVCQCVCAEFLHEITCFLMFVALTWLCRVLSCLHWGEPWQKTLRLWSLFFPTALDQSLNTESRLDKRGFTHNTKAISVWLFLPLLLSLGFV